MTSTRFDAATRFAGVMPSRRQTLAALLGGLPGLALTAGSDEVNAKRKGNKKCKKCGQCQKCQNGKCKPKAAGTPCGQGKQCAANGRCEACDVCPSGCAFTSVQAAIDDAAPGETIRLCAGVFDGPLRIAKDLTLIGAGDDAQGTTIDGRGDGNNSTVTVTDFATVELKGLRITGSNDGGINNNFGKLTLTACTVSGNKDLNSGGGIFNEGNEERGELILNDTTVADNEAEFGGGIFSNGNLVLNNSIVRDNAAEGKGGGVFLTGRGSLTLNESRVEGNTAGAAGGGIRFFNVTPLTLNASTVSGNTPNNLESS